MEKNSRQGYFLQWLIGVGDLVLINALFLVLYRALSADYTRLIGHSLKEIILLLNFCYFFALYFVPVRVHLSVVFLDNIVKRSFMLITFQMIMFTTCLIFMRIGHGSARFLIILYGTLLVGRFFAVARGDASDCKDLSAEGVQREKRDHCGGRKERAGAVQSAQKRHGVRLQRVRLFR